MNCGDQGYNLINMGFSLVVIFLKSHVTYQMNLKTFVGLRNELSKKTFSTPSDYDF